MRCFHVMGGSAVVLPSDTHPNTAQGTAGSTGESGGSAGEHTPTAVMKMLLSFVLLSLLFPPALALECYVCSASTTNEQCNQNSQDCQSPLDTCMTSVDTQGQAKAIVKQCASEATCSGAAASSSVDANGNGNSVNCCNSFNLCNFSGAESVRVHTTLLLITGVVLRLLSL